jgi:hypothetical protein
MQVACTNFTEEVTMDPIILLFLGALVVLVLHSMFPSVNESEYMVIPVQRPQRGMGCLPVLVIAILVVVVMALAQTNY